VLRLVKIPLFAVADGFGGVGAGDVAASAAVSVVKNHTESLLGCNRAVADDRSTSNRLALSDMLDDIFNQASRSIGTEAKRLGKHGMGATMVLATIVRNYAYIAHIGNARAYLVREGRVIRLTEDHTVAEFRFRRGRISREEYETSPDRSVLYQSLGAGVEVDVDLAEVRLAGGDALLLCSDGLPRALSDDQIVEGIEPADLARSVRKLMALANRAGAEDNVSAILIGVDADEGDEPLEAITDIMKSVFLFEKLTQPERLIIAPYLEEVVVPTGHTIAGEGDPADCFYVVVSGRVRVSSGGVHLTDVKRGGHFGEIALARPVNRSATVRALTETRMFSLTRERFQDLLRNKPDLGAKLALSLLDAVGDRLRDLSERLKAAERALKPQPDPGDQTVKTQRD